jgi:hypothetical protein
MGRPWPSTIFPRTNVASEPLVERLPAVAARPVAVLDRVALEPELLLALVVMAADMYRRHVARSCSPSAPRARRLAPWPTAGRHLTAMGR